MLVDPMSVSLATYFLQHTPVSDLGREVTQEEIRDLRVSLAEAIQAAIEDWFRDLPELFTAEEKEPA